MRKKRELPTKDELIEEIEFIVDANGKEFGHMNGNLRPYKPEIVAPAKRKPVFFTNPDGIVNIGLSKGKFDVHGRLCVIGGHISDEKHPDYRKIINSNHAVEWCSVKNSDHHSAGWRKEWEPKE